MPWQGPMCSCSRSMWNTRGYAPVISDSDVVLLVVSAKFRWLPTINFAAVLAMKFAHSLAHHFIRYAGSLFFSAFPYAQSTQQSGTLDSNADHCEKATTNELNWSAKQTEYGRSIFDFSDFPAISRIRNTVAISIRRCGIECLLSDLSIPSSYRLSLLIFVFSLPLSCAMHGCILWNERCKDTHRRLRWLVCFCGASSLFSRPERFARRQNVYTEWWSGSNKSEQRAACTAPKNSN